MIVVKQTPTPILKFLTIPTQTIQIIKKNRRPRPVYPPCETCGKTNHSTEKCYSGANAANRPPPRNKRPEGQNQVQQRNAQSNSEGNVQAAAQNFKLQTPRLDSGTAIDRPETTEIPKLPPIPEVVWQQPKETITDQANLTNTNKDSSIYNTQETSKTTLASHTSPPKGTQPQNYVVTIEHPPGNQTGNEPVPFLNCSNKYPTDTQNSEQQLTGDTTVTPLTTTIPLIEEGLVRDEQTNEVYLPLTSTVVLKRKQEMLYVPLDIEENLTVDALVNSWAYVSVIAQNDLDTNKGKTPNIILKIDDPPNFQILVANGQLEKPLASATLKFELEIILSLETSL